MRLMETSQCNSLKRKRSTAYLSSPPSSNPDEQALDQVSESVGSLTPETVQEKIQAPPDPLPSSFPDSYPLWPGRGRSPYPTPSTAALDALKSDTRRLELYYREVKRQNVRINQLFEETEQKYQTNYFKIQKMAGSRARGAAESNPMNAPKLDPPLYPAQSASPSRHIQALQRSRPRMVRMEDVNDLQEEEFKAVQAAIALLEQDLGHSCIPKRYKEHLQKQRLGSHVYGDNPSSMSAQQSLFDAANKIKTVAKTCELQQRDESSWCQKVVLPVMNWERDDSRECMESPYSQSEPIHTQTINSTCLPTDNAKAVDSKKADYALSFSLENATISRDFAKVPQGAVLSQMTDPCTEKLILYLGAEVKKHGEKELDAQAQLFTWLAAGIIRTRQLMKLSKSDSAQAEMFPLVGFTIVGHAWELYLATGRGNEQDDDIVIFGPFHGCMISTRSLLDCFKLLQLMERIKKWAREKYWPWYVKAIIDPLAKLQNDDDHNADEWRGFGEE